MASNKLKRLRPSVLQADVDGFAALKAIEVYLPINGAYTVKALSAAHALLTEARDGEAQAAAQLTAARQRAVAREWEFHQLMLGAKDQVVAQFGKDSDEVQAVGLKKKSEYKSPGRKTNATSQTQ